MNKILLTTKQLEDILDWYDINEARLGLGFKPFLMSGVIDHELTQEEWEQAEKRHADRKEDGIKLFALTTPKIEFRIEALLDKEDRRYWVSMDYNIVKNNSFGATEKKVLTFEFDPVKPALFRGKLPLPKNIKVHLSTSEIMSLVRGSSFTDSEEQVYKDERYFVFDSIRRATLYFLAVNSYFFHYQAEDVAISEREVRKPTQAKKSGQIVTKWVKVLEKSYRIKGKVHRAKAKHIWHLAVWGVCGHERHYKDGRVIVIAPFKKGKDRFNSEPSDKTYLVRREKE